MDARFQNLDNEELRVLAAALWFFKTKKTDNAEHIDAIATDLLKTVFVELDAQVEDED